MPQIERIKTEVYFTDSRGTEWEVVDARRRADGKLWRQYPGVADAELRYFVRYQPRDGLNLRSIVEVRRYRFDGNESRWFQADLFEQQIRVSERRSALRT